MTFFTQSNTKNISTVLSIGALGTVTGALVGATFGAAVGPLGAAINGEADKITPAQINAAGDALVYGIIGMIVGGLSGLKREGFLTFKDDDCAQFTPLCLTAIMLFTLPIIGGALGYAMLKNGLDNPPSALTSTLHSLEAGYILEAALGVVGALVTFLCFCTCIKWDGTDNDNNNRSSVGPTV